MVTTISLILTNFYLILYFKLKSGSFLKIRMCDIQLVKIKLEGRKETLVASSASTLSLRKCLKVIYKTGK